MKVREVSCKSALVKSGLPGADYVINPYVGCQHACVYCYSRFMKRFTGHTEPWGHFLDAKVNIADVLKKELPKAKRGLTLLSSVTDPYLPSEARYKLTRQCLTELLVYQWPTAILTKSVLVLRDIDLLKQFKRMDVGLTITSTSNTVSKAFEPMASPANARIKALAKLHRAGIRTYCFIGPILPELTDLEGIFAAVRGSVDEVWCESLNTRGGNWPGVKAALAAHWPELVPKYEDIFFVGSSKRQYLRNLEKEIRGLSKKYDIKLRLFLEH
jgi:DNA repair photolyase